MPRSGGNAKAMQHRKPDADPEQLIITHAGHRFCELWKSVAKF
jgi:hypothetical protein